MAESSYGKYLVMCRNTRRSTGGAARILRRWGVQLIQLLKHSLLFLKSPSGMAAEFTLKCFKHWLSYWSFRQKGKIHEVGALRAKEREETLSPGTRQTLPEERPRQWPTCKPGLVSPHFADQDTRPQEEEARCLRAAADHPLSWDSTLASASGLRLTLAGPVTYHVYCSSTIKINKLDPNQENKGIMRLHKTRAIKKKKKGTDHSPQTR